MKAATERLNAQGVDELDDPRLTFLWTLTARLSALQGGLDEMSVRERISRIDQLLRQMPDVLRARQTRANYLYWIASLTMKGQTLRGYKSGVSKYHDHATLAPDQVLTDGLRNSRGVLAQLPEEADRQAWLAGFRRG